MSPNSLTSFVGQRAPVTQLSFDIDAQDRVEATRLAKIRFCALEGISEWSIDQQKPRGARFVDAKPALVTKAANLLGFKVYEATAEEVAEAAEKLPLGRLYANGRGFVPNIRQSLYSDVVVALGLEPQATLNKNGNERLPAARGLPQSWTEIAPGHLVIAQESLDYGWWEAIVLDRRDDILTLQYRDYPHLPKFVRHLSSIALMCPPDDEGEPAAQPEQA